MGPDLLDPLLAVAAHTGEAAFTGALVVFFGLLSWAGFHRGRAPLGWFYAVAAVLAAALTAVAASGHVFHGW